MTRSILFVVSLLAAGTAYSQHHGGYAGQQDRVIKALSEEETKQYLAGAGMGYARAAELNGYPGPMHVLELADRLELSADQRAATQKLMESHKTEARAIGAKRIAAEKSLDELFKAGGVDQQRLAEAVRVTAQIEGEYRLSHLDTHRQMRAMLSDHQVARYNVLRGYTKAKHSH